MLGPDDEAFEATVAGDSGFPLTAAEAKKHRISLQAHSRLPIEDSAQLYEDTEMTTAIEPVASTTLEAGGVAENLEVEPDSNSDPVYSEHQDRPNARPSSLTTNPITSTQQVSVNDDTSNLTPIMESTEHPKSPAIFEDDTTKIPSVAGTTKDDTHSKTMNASDMITDTSMSTGSEDVLPKSTQSAESNDEIESKSNTIVDGETSKINPSGVSNIDKDGNDSNTPVDATSPTATPQSAEINAATRASLIDDGNDEADSSSTSDGEQPDDGDDGENTISGDSSEMPRSTKKRREKEITDKQRAKKRKEMEIETSRFMRDSSNCSLILKEPAPPKKQLSKVLAFVQPSLPMRSRSQSNSGGSTGPSTAAKTGLKQRQALLKRLSSAGLLDKKPSLGRGAGIRFSSKSLNAHELLEKGAQIELASSFSPRKLGKINAASLNARSRSEKRTAASLWRESRKAVKQLIAERQRDLIQADETAKMIDNEEFGEENGATFPDEDGEYAENDERIENDADASMAEDGDVEVDSVSPNEADVAGEELELVEALESEASRTTNGRPETPLLMNTIAPRGTPELFESTPVKPISTMLAPGRQESVFKSGGSTPLSMLPGQRTLREAVTPAEYSQDGYDKVESHNSVRDESCDFVDEQSQYLDSNGFVATRQDSAAPSDSTSHSNCLTFPPRKLDTSDRTTERTATVSDSHSVDGALTNSESQAENISELVGMCSGVFPTQSSEVQAAATSDSQEHIIGKRLNETNTPKDAMTSIAEHEDSTIEAATVEDSCVEDTELHEESTDNIGSESAEANEFILDEAEADSDDSDYGCNDEYDEEDEYALIEEAEEVNSEAEADTHMMQMEDLAQDANTPAFLMKYVTENKSDEDSDDMDEKNESQNETEDVADEELSKEERRALRKKRKEERRERRRLRREAKEKARMEAEAARQEVESQDMFEEPELSDDGEVDETTRAEKSNARQQWLASRAKEASQQELSMLDEGSQQIRSMIRRGSSSSSQATSLGATSDAKGKPPFAMFGAKRKASGDRPVLSRKGSFMGRRSDPSLKKLLSGSGASKTGGGSSSTQGYAFQVTSSRDSASNHGDIKTGEKINSKERAFQGIGASKKKSLESPGGKHPKRKPLSTLSQKGGRSESRSVFARSSSSLMKALNARPKNK